MTNWSLIGPAPLTSFFNEQANTANSLGTLSMDKTTDGGNWVEYSASWPETTNRLKIFSFDFATNRAGGFDIGIGGAGSEIKILELPATDRLSRAYNGLVFPITIRVGERVSIRPVTVAGNDPLLVGLTGYFDPLFRTDLRRSDMMGLVDKNTPTVPDPGGTINTVGAWAQIIAATANDYKALLFAFTQLATNTDISTVQHLFDIGVGTGGSEVAIASKIYAQRKSRGSSPETRHYYIDAQLSAGVRLAVRAQADNNVVGVRDALGVVVIGFY